MPKKKDDFMNEHTIKLQGKDYTLVAARIVAFRSDHPDWTVSTDIRQVGEKFYVYATVAKPMLDAAGNPAGHAVIATAHKEVGKASGGAAKWPLETAETGAIGRALGLAGYGTLSGDFDEGDQLADAPVARSGGKSEPDTTPESEDSNVIRFPSLAQEDASADGDDSKAGDDGNGQDDEGLSAEYPTEPAELIKKINYCRRSDKLEAMRLHVRTVALAYPKGDENRNAIVSAFQSKEEVLKQKGV